MASNLATNSVRSLLEAMPGAPFVASLLLVVRPGAPNSFLFLIAMASTLGEAMASKLIAKGT